MQGMDNRKWLEKGYTICMEGVKAKFTQNLDLINMLRTTKPKLLAEAIIHIGSGEQEFTYIIQKHWIAASGNPMVALQYANEHKR